MSDHDRGQVDTSAAQIYDELFVPSLFGRFSDDVADQAGIGPDDSVLDVACGTGALARTIRERTGGRVVGADLNPGMLAVARSHGDDIDYRQADAQSLPFDDDEFDLAACQFGLMFLPDPAQGVAEMARVARRGVVAVWNSIDRSSGYLAMQELFRSEHGEEAAASLDAPFVLGGTGPLEAIFAEADIDGVTYGAIDGTGRFDSIAHWVTTEVRGWTLGDAVTDDDLARLVGTAETQLARFAGPDGCVFGMGARVATWD